ncbi:hypothetical protein D8674_026376 [Pyrus ussuriensis x Pyrus communis]|uniref:Uncharacterized protein n=1 Tax=Pyrus ussuriensis x Pyrus communis TaxID=2448454 RepID=A0A5N5IBG0_9ROSA|nr:hypothetical protein D8674_026376 [Pyrus ussuriensis x Pyrus communis]
MAIQVLHSAHDSPSISTSLIGQQVIVAIGSSSSTNLQDLDTPSGSAEHSNVRIEEIPGKNIPAMEAL